MANIRTLKLNLLADISGFERGIRRASKESSGFAKNIGRNFALAGAAIGGAAISMGITAVKAAAEDEQSQIQLAKALKNTTGATRKQIGQTEKWISKTQLAYGISDDKLRPSLAKLTKVTGDVGKSQELVGLAMDLSASSGVDLETATNAIAKAQMGQFKGLKSLGIPLTDSIVKNKDLAGALKMTEDRVNGAAKAMANTGKGKLDRFTEAFKEFREAIGYKLMKYLMPLADKYFPKIIKGLEDFMDGLAGKGKTPMSQLGQSVKNMAEALKKVFDALNTNDDGKTRSAAESIASLADSINKLATALTVAATAIKKVKDGYSWLINHTQINGESPFSPPDLFPERKKGLPSTTAPGGTTSGGGTSSPMAFRARGGHTTVINLNGIVDGESARRTIETLLQKSSLRTGPINFEGSAI